MRKFRIVFLLAAVLCCAASAFGQTQGAPTLRIVTEDPNLPSDLYYGNIRVKPLRLRPGTNQRITIDDSDFFVQQQYIDFLGRFPDTGGFSYWNKQITDCNGDAGCVERMRVNTSAAFFISTEFQQTGYYVYRFYKAALNRMPRYAELIPDKQRVSNGVIVLAPGWEAKLETNKRAFAEAWAARADFAPYLSMSPEIFVDTLFGNIGVTPSAADRAALINELRAGSSRAVVLRKIVENDAVYRREYNPAFVLIQYFGYLKRNPDDAPDGNMDGFNFWLRKLNNFNTDPMRAELDFAKAEMVRAFVLSSEYRGRF